LWPVTTIWSGSLELLVLISKEPITIAPGNFWEGTGVTVRGSSTPGMESSVSCTCAAEYRAGHMVDRQFISDVKVRLVMLPEDTKSLIGMGVEKDGDFNTTGRNPSTSRDVRVGRKVKGIDNRWWM
jgi:hypothetical protein